MDFLQIFPQLLLILSVQSVKFEQPKISIGYYSTLEDSFWDYSEYGQPEGPPPSSSLTPFDIRPLEIDWRLNELIVPAHYSSVTLVCNASYPVQWTYNVYEESLSLSLIRIKTHRTATNIYDPATFDFISTVDLMGEASTLTGEYACESIDKRFRKELYVYWQGEETPPYLVLAGRSIRIKSRDGKTILLPCYVSDPNATVSLFKQHDQAFEHLPLNESINFSPRVGFTLDLHSLSSPFGSFKCLIGDELIDDEENEDAVYFHVLSGIERTKPDFPDVILANTSFEYNSEKRALICCSMTERPPSLHTLFCSSPTDCQMRAMHLFKYSNRKDYNLKNGSCTIKPIYFGEMGIFRCKGEGIDISRNFITPYTYEHYLHNNYTIPLYFSWNEIEPDKMMSLHVGKRMPTFYSPDNPNYHHEDLFDTEEVILTCDISHFYFSDGVQWALRWENNSVQFLDESYSLIKQGVLMRDSTTSNEVPYIPHKSFSSTFMETIELELKRGMKSIVCFAPVWNSTEWVNKSFEFEIKTPSKPEFEGPEIENEHWKLNDTDKILYCPFKANPQPRIRFRKNNKTIRSQHNIGIKIKNGTGTIKVSRVSHDSQGVYQCIAVNLGGRTVKSFHVYVYEEEKSRGMHGGFVALIVIILVAFIGGIGFLVWKLQLQKNVIGRLTTIVFRDLSNSQNQTPPTNGTNGVAQNSEIPSIPGQSQHL